MTETEKKKTAKRTTPKKTTTKDKTTKTKKDSQKTTKTTTKKVKLEKIEPKNIRISGFNDLQLNTYVYENCKEPKAVVVIVHGMQEHCLRYKHFAEYLNTQNYIVITSDLRGHGKTSPSKDERGYGEKDIFSESVQDQLNIINYAYETYSLPICLFGHSYGSMLSQNIIQNTSLVEKCVLCGTANGSSTIMKLGGMIASMMSPFKKQKSTGGMIEKMCVKSYGKGFENGNWLSRDAKVFKEYQKDEYCGGSFPFSFYKSLLKNMNKVNDGIEKIGNKKIFLIAGDQDPVGAKGKQVQQLYKLYLKNNIDAKIKLYQDARHELLNETNKEEVYQDVVNFFDN